MKNEVEIIQELKREKSEIETITNSNGTAIKFSDGTMICYLATTISDFAVNNPYGSLFISTWIWNYPVSFIENPIVTCGQFKVYNTNSWGTVTGANKNYASLQCIDVNARAAGADVYIRATAIGRWK